MTSIDESRWLWFIPLHDGSTSVGIVMDKSLAAQKKKQYSGEHFEKLLPFYLDELKRAPGATKLLANSQLKIPEGSPPVKTTSDFSYAASDYAGDHFRLAGDAGGAR